MQQGLWKLGEWDSAEKTLDCLNACMGGAVNMSVSVCATGESAIAPVACLMQGKPVERLQYHQNNTCTYFRSFRMRIGGVVTHCVSEPGFLSIFARRWKAHAYVTQVGGNFPMIGSTYTSYN
jgi:hypothetical protein